MKISDFLGKQVDDVLSVFGKEVTLSDDETIFLNDIYLEIPQRGICLISDRQSGEIYCAQLYGPGKEDSYEAFSGHVNGDLFSLTRKIPSGKNLVPPIKAILATLKWPILGIYSSIRIFEFTANMRQMAAGFCLSACKMCVV